MDRALPIHGSLGIDHALLLGRCGALGIDRARLLGRCGALGIDHARLLGRNGSLGIDHTRLLGRGRSLRVDHALLRYGRPRSGRRGLDSLFLNISGGLGFQPDRIDYALFAFFTRGGWWRRNILRLLHGLGINYLLLINGLTVIAGLGIGHVSGPGSVRVDNLLTGSNLHHGAVLHAIFTLLRFERLGVISGLSIDRLAAAQNKQPR